jgi:hypothetical protein
VTSLRTASVASSSGPWWLAPLLASSAACSGDAHATRLPARSPGEELYRVVCRNSIEQCRNKATEICLGQFATLEVTGGALEPERVSSAPGPSSTGPRYRRAKWVGQMVVSCGNARHSCSPIAPEFPETTRSARELPAGKVCIPGATQACLGPGACHGAQPCLENGEAYGACDCGASNSNADDEPTHGMRTADAGAAPR